MILLDVTSRIWRLLTPHGRRRLLGLWVLLTVTSVLEALGMFCWYPIVVYVSDPAALREVSWLARAYAALGFESEARFVTAATLSMVGLIAAITTLRVVSTMRIYRFLWSERTRLGERLLSAYLHQPYAWFLDQNTAALAREVTQEVKYVIDFCMLTLLTLYSELVLTGVMLVGVVVMDPWIAVVTLAVVGGLFVVTFDHVKVRLSEAGQERLERTHAAWQGVTEALLAVKEARASPWSLDHPMIVREHLDRLVDIAVDCETLSRIRGLATEVTVKLAVLGVALYLVLVDHPEALAVVTVYVVAVVRLAPELHGHYRKATNLRFHLPVLERVQPFLEAPEAPECRERLALQEGVRLEGVHFRYPGRDEEALTEVDLELPRRTSLALVGETGAGKTTVADVVAGLLCPTRGRVLVDGEPLDASSTLAWRNAVGYVPQEVYLVEASVRENIAFGVPPEDIDEDAVRAAARAASIEDFVLSLPEGFETRLGERGQTISGGQRQRLAIARALYHDPEVLIFDEATSALDNDTEGEVLRAVAALATRKTLLVIAHRLSTVRSCDRIVFLERGRVVASGTYEELLEELPAFAAMVEAGEIPSEEGASRTKSSSAATTRSAETR